MSTQFQKTILEANEEYAKGYSSKGLSVVPSKKAAIITCMDARLNPAAAYGLEPGSVIVIRNAGASGRDGARSALLSCHLLGIDEVLIVKHTNCGLLGATMQMAHDAMRKNLGVAESKDIDSFDPIAIKDLQTSAEEDVAYLRQHPLAIKKVTVTGWIHDTDTGRVKKVVE